MAALDKEKKSNRLLGSRRYTHDTLLDSQEAFTEVLDIGASEVYTQAKFIPSSGLPFSCLLYTSPSPRDLSTSRMPSSA